MKPPFPTTDPVSRCVPASAAGPLVQQVLQAIRASGAVPWTQLIDGTH
jgi:hypothetical protein